MPCFKKHPWWQVIWFYVKWVWHHFVAMVTQIPIKCTLYLKLSSLATKPLTFHFSVGHSDNGGALVAQS